MYFLRLRKGLNESQRWRPAVQELVFSEINRVK